MPTDVFKRHFVLEVEKANNNLTQDEMNLLRYMMDKAEASPDKKDEYIVISKSKLPNTYAEIMNIVNKP